MPASSMPGRKAVGARPLPMSADSHYHKAEFHDGFNDHSDGLFFVATPIVGRFPYSVGALSGLPFNGMFVVCYYGAAGQNYLKCPRSWRVITVNDGMNSSANFLNLSPNGIHTNAAS